MTTIYIDMDGVVADFNQAARAYLKGSMQDAERAEHEGRWPESEWRRLRDLPNFYRHLPKTAYADTIMQWARRFRDELGWDLYMLTAIPKNNDMADCIWDKVLWMQEHYPDVRARFGPYSQDKQHHHRPGDVLVDDRISNCDEWRQAGGKAIRVRAWQPEQAIQELESVFVKCWAELQDQTELRS
jgi:hypothetical protein